MASSKNTSPDIGYTFPPFDELPSVLGQRQGSLALDDMLGKFLSADAIPVSEIEEVLRWQVTECKRGDIFIMQTGFVKWHEHADAATRTHGTREQHYMIGVANTMETVRWLYDKHFSAVAGDTMGFEAWPYPEDYCLHEWLLCQWGTPIGELWDLEQLSRFCGSLRKWSFLFNSAPLHIKGGIGSPPGAIAIL